MFHKLLYQQELSNPLHFPYLHRQQPQLEYLFSSLQSQLRQYQILLYFLPFKPLLSFLSFFPFFIKIHFFVKIPLSILIFFLYFLNYQNYQISIFFPHIFQINLFQYSQNPQFSSFQP